MAPQIRKVQSQEVINVSQDFSSDPILKNTPPRSHPSAPPVSENNTEDRVEESLTYDYVLGNKLQEQDSASNPTDAHAHDTGADIDETHRNRSPQTTTLPGQAAVAFQGLSRSLGDTQVAAGHLYSSATTSVDSAGAALHTGNHVEDDLYGATPPRKSQVDFQRLTQRRDATGASPVNGVRRSSVAKLYEGEAPNVSPLRDQPLLRPNLQQPNQSPSTGSQNPSMAKNTVLSANTTAPGANAMQSTGKLLPAKGALAALQERKQQILGRTGETSTKLFDRNDRLSTRAAHSRGQKQDSPAKDPSKVSKAPKAKDKMKVDGRSPKPATDKSNIREGAQKPIQPAHAGSKRKTMADTVTERSAVHADKRLRAAARKQNGPPAEPGHPMASASDVVQPDDSYDLPESPIKAGSSKRTMQPAGKPAVKPVKPVKPAVKEDVPVSKKGSATIERPRKAADDQNLGKGRNLRSRKAQQSSVEPAAAENTVPDAADNLDDSNDTHLDAEIPPPNNAVHSHKRPTRRGSNSNDDEHTGRPLIKQEHPLAVASIEPSVVSPDNANPSGSQFNAIVLSDHTPSELSSSVDQDFLPPKMLPEDSKKSAARLQTPAAVQSSPPKVSSRAGSQSLRGTGRSRKAQIISFDKTGPLNQGSAPKSLNTRASVPPLTVAVNWGPSTTNVNLAARQKASSVADSVRSGKSNVAAPPSNVAHDVHDALTGLSKSKPQRNAIAVNAVKSVRVSAPARIEDGTASSTSQDDVHHEVDDGGFATVDDMEKFMNSPSPGQQLNAEQKHAPTASQVVMPPPGRKVNLPRKVAETTLSRRNPAQPAPASAPAASCPESGAVVTQATPSDTPHAPEISASSATHSSLNAASKTDGKRPILVEASPERPAKRAKASASKDIPAIPRSTHSTKTVLEQPAKRVNPSSSTVTTAFAQDFAQPLETVSAPTEPSVKQTKILRSTTMKPSNTSGLTTTAQEPAMPTMTAMVPRASAEPHSKSNVNPSAKGRPSPKPEVKSPRKAAQPLNIKNVRRKQVRYISQNSQTVDVNGSPVPPDMEVTDLSTALETFSQQAEESSSITQRPPPRFKTPMEAAYATEDDAFSVPPSYQPPTLSSNPKARPGPSGSRSKTIRHLKLTKVESDAFMSKRTQATALSDPFAVSQAPTDSVLPVKHQDHLLERTRNFAQEIGRPTATVRDNCRAQIRSPEKVPSLVRATATMESKAIVAPEFASKFASNLDKQVAALREHTAYARATEEDPDKTLVDDCSQDTEISIETSLGSSAVSSRDASQEPIDEVEEPEPSSQSSNGDEDDLRVWRKGLKPHQLGLYEELVKIARVVTIYVTGQETSADVMIDENYRRELVMVEQEEEVRKKQYKQYLTNLQQKKKEKVQELLSLEKVLQGVLDASSVCWEEHCDGRTEKERANRKVAGLISSWS